MTGSAHWQYTTPRRVTEEPPVEPRVPPSVAEVWVTFAAVGVLTAGGVLPVADFRASHVNANGMTPSMRCQRQTMPEFCERFAPVQPLRVEPAPRIVPADVAQRLSATTRSVEPWVVMSPVWLAGLITIVPNMPSLATVPLDTKLAAFAEVLSTPPDELTMIGPS